MSNPNNPVQYPTGWLTVDTVADLLAQAFAAANSLPHGPEVQQVQAKLAEARRALDAHVQHTMLPPTPLQDGPLPAPVGTAGGYTATEGRVVRDGTGEQVGTYQVRQDPHGKKLALVVQATVSGAAMPTTYCTDVQGVAMAVADFARSVREWQLAGRPQYL